MYLIKPRNVCVDTPKLGYPLLLGQGGTHVTIHSHLVSSLPRLRTWARPAVPLASEPGHPMPRGWEDLLGHFNHKPGLLSMGTRLHVGSPDPHQGGSRAATCPRSEGSLQLLPGGRPPQDGSRPLWVLFGPTTKGVSSHHVSRPVFLRRRLGDT
jgi:hypothetical protein